MKHVIIGTAGHVDHGKTALIKALTDIDCDTHREEKERGITINLGFSHLDLPTGQSIGIVDMPGHKDFIKTMVAGAYGIDIALLVIAADSGIMPQTIEHFRIIEMLGIEYGIIALNKSDLVDEETLELAELEIAEFLEGTKLANAPIVPVSALAGTGLEALKEEINKLVPELKEKEIVDQFRMYIDRIFNVKGVVFVVTGSVLEGDIETGKDLFLLPSKSKKVKIRNIERHGEVVEKVYRGDRAALNLAGLKFEDYSRGMVLSNKVIEPTEMIDATFTMFDRSSFIPIWSNVIFYSGTFECGARMHLLDKDELNEGDTAIVQLHLSKPAVLQNKDKYILRNSANDVTLGGGTIVDMDPLHHKKRTEKIISSLKDLVEATLHSDKLINLVKIELNKINAPVYLNEIAEKINKPVSQIIEEIEMEKKSGVILFDKDLEPFLVKESLDSDYRKFVLDEIGSWHQKNPILDEGLETNEFIGKLNFAKNESGKRYLEILMKRIAEDGEIVRIGNTWSLNGHEVKIDPKTKEQLTWLENKIKAVGFELPLAKDIAQLAHENKINKERLKMLVTYLGKQGKFVFYQGEYIHHTIADRSREMLLPKVYNNDAGINEKQFRELINGTKKLVQFLLGRFIEEGIVIKDSFYIRITEKGNRWMENKK
jgi:selenocysteine-specific elongation factor